MGLKRTWGKLYLAAHKLIVANAPLKERLGSAFRFQITGLTPQDFAEGGPRRNFESLHVNTDSAEGLGTDSLSVGECSQAAETILRLLIEITRTMEHEDHGNRLKNQLLGGS